MAYNIAKCRYKKTFEDGKTKFVTEKYLIDSLSVTEAEARAIEELTPWYAGMEVKDVVSTKIESVWGDTQCGKFYLAKVNIINVDEKSGKEKKTAYQWLIGAEDYDAAKAVVADEIKKSMADTEIVGITESSIVGFIPCKL